MSPRPTVAEWWRAKRRRLLELWIVGIAVSAGVTAASALGYLDGAQAQSLDLLMKLRDPAPVSDVVIVAIDEAAFAALGHRQPLPRDYLAKVIRGVRRSGAAVVGLDIELSTATSDGDDAALATAMREFSDQGVSRVVVVSTERPPSGPLGRRELQDALVRGVADMPEDSDGVIRRTNLVIRRDVGLEPSFGLAVLARMGGLDQHGLQQALGKRRQGLRAPVLRPGVGWRPSGDPIHAEPDDLQRINFVGPAATFLTFSSQTLAAFGEPGAAVPPADSPLKGRIVLVGATFGDSRDFYETPYGKLSGVEIHANVVHMLATRTFVRPTGWVLSFGIQVVLVLVAGVLLTALNPLAGTVICLVGAVVIGLPASYLIFERGHYWIDFMLPVFATRVLGWGVDLLDRPHARKIIDRYVGVETAASLSGERREVSIVVAGLPELAALSEKMTPDEVATQLGDYVTAMGEAIVHHDGVIDRISGDVVVAVFGGPARPDHPVLAVRAAAAMHDAVAALNERWTAAGLPRLRTGVGMHTGRVIAAGVGDDKSVLRTTVVGVDVEVALHVYALTTELDTTATLLTEATRAAVGDRMPVRDHGALSMKQLGAEVRVYELIGRES